MDLESPKSTLSCQHQFKVDDPAYNGSESQYLQVLQNLNDAIIIIDARGIISYFNPSAETLFGYSAKEVVGHNISMLMPSPQREEHDFYLERYHSTGEMRIIGVEREVLALKKDGSTFPMEMNVSEIVINGVRSFSGCIKNISQRKKEKASFSLMSQSLLYEKQYNSNLIDTANAIIIVVDLEGTVQVFNFYASKLTGYASEEVLGRNYCEILIPSKNIASLHKLHLHSEHGQFIEESELPILTKSGEERIISWRKSLLHQGSEVAGVLCFGVDITKQKEQQISLDKAFKELEFKVQARTKELLISNQILEKEIQDRRVAENAIANSLSEKEVFLKEIHHRVKNNLQLIISILNLHMREMEESAAKEVLSEIRDRIFSISHLYEMLYQSKDLTCVDIESYLRSLVSNLLQSSGESRDIQVSYQIEPISLNLDETLRCGLVINELILNSIKYAFIGKSKKLISLSLSQRSKGAILIEVEDNGIGLPLNYAKPKAGGIGFYLVEKLTEKLGGVVCYSNTPGACVQVSFIPEVNHNERE